MLEIPIPKPFIENSKKVRKKSNNITDRIFNELSPNLDKKVKSSSSNKKAINLSKKRKVLVKQKQKKRVIKKPIKKSVKLKRKLHKKPTKRKNHVKKTVKIKLVSKPKLAHHNPIHNHKVHHKKHPIHKKIHHKIKKALKQSHYRARSLKHMKITKIFIKRKNIEKAKKNYSLALINYFKMPGHENEIYFKLRSLLKQIESLETHPHYDFHESSKKIMKLKKDQKKITHETLYAIKDFNLALKSQSSIGIPQIRRNSEIDLEEPTHDGFKQVEKPVYNFEEFVPKQEPKKVEIVKVHEKVKLSPIQKRILKKVRELEVEKERLEEKLNN